MLMISNYQNVSEMIVFVLNLDTMTDLIMSDMWVSSNQYKRASICQTELLYSHGNWSMCQSEPDTAFFTQATMDSVIVVFPHTITSICIRGCVRKLHAHLLW